MVGANGTDSTMMGVQPDRRVLETKRPTGAAPNNALGVSCGRERTGDRGPGRLPGESRRGADLRTLAGGPPDGRWRAKSAHRRSDEAGSAVLEDPHRSDAPNEKAGPRERGAGRRLASVPERGSKNALSRPCNGSSSGTEPAAKNHDCKHDDGGENHRLQRYQIDGAEGLVPDRVSASVRNSSQSFSELSEAHRKRPAWRRQCAAARSRLGSLAITAVTTRPTVRPTTAEAAVFTSHFRTPPSTPVS